MVVYLLQVGYSVTSPVMSDKEIYPYFSRTIEATSLNNPAIIKILRHFSWRKIAKLTSDTVHAASVSGTNICMLLYVCRSVYPHVGLYSRLPVS